MRNKRLVGKIDSSFIVVSDNMPIIEVYDDKSLDLIHQFDYSYIPQIKSLIIFEKTNPIEREDSYRCISEDMCITNNHLYISIYTRNKSVHDSYLNLIIKFEIKPEIKPVSVLKLPGRWFTTFCVDENDGIIYAYNNPDNSIGAYLIPKTPKNE